MFEGYAVRDLQTDRGTIHARVGGGGPPLLLLHGYPESHLMWHGAADALAQRFAVVAADLPGYGDSLRPEPAPDHAPHSKRAMARDLVQAMGELGHARFAVAGHDRGGRVAYRMALDDPDRVSALAVLDIVPTAEVWARADARFALGYWHWGFLAQPAPLPESMIAADPGAFFDLHLRRMGIGGDPDRYPAEVLDAYRSTLADPGAVTAMCEDYRAGASIDRELDEADNPLGSRGQSLGSRGQPLGSRGRRAGRSIDCPLLVLWGERGALPSLYDDVPGIWRGWAADVRGRALDSTHFIPEDRPDETAAELAAFLAEVG